MQHTHVVGKSIIFTLQSYRSENCESNDESLEEQYIAAVTMRRLRAIVLAVFWITHSERLQMEPLQ